MGGLLEPEGRKAFHLKLCHLAVHFYSAMAWYHPGIFFGHRFSCTSVIAKILMKRVAFEQISLYRQSSVAWAMPFYRFILFSNTDMYFQHILFRFFFGKRWNKSRSFRSCTQRFSELNHHSLRFPCFPLRWSDGASGAWSICTTVPWWWNVTSLFCIFCDERNRWKTGKNPWTNHGSLGTGFSSSCQIPVIRVDHGNIGHHLSGRPLVLSLHVDVILAIISNIRDMLSQNL